MSNINVCFAAFRRWQLPERKRGGRKSKVKKKRKKKFDTSCTRLRSYLDHNRFLLIRNGLGDRCIYHCGSCLACLFLMHRLYYLPRSRDNIILAYISGVMVGVLYMSQYIKIFFYRWVLVVYWDWWFSVLSGLMLSVTYSRGKFASLVYIITTVK